MDLVPLLLCLAFCLKVNSMAIQGPPLTRYDPCGLGVIRFDKMTQSLWRGTIFFELYPYLTQAQIDIHFGRQVEITGASQDSSISVKDDWHHFVLSPKGTLPEQYSFYLRLADNGTEVPTVTRFILNNATLCNEAIKAATTLESLNRTASEHEAYRHVCGRRSLEHAELTSVRTEAQAGDWPWHVAMLKRNPYTGVPVYECGGNIISRTAVLTAGHCVSKGGIMIEARLVIVIAGVNNHSDFNQAGRQSLTAKEIVLHPGYSDPLATSDLAIIRVAKFMYTEYVQPICIWGPVYDKSNMFGKQAVVVGFGYTEKNIQSQTLRSAYTMVQNDTTCITYSPAIYANLLNEFSFCAGYGPTSGINPRNGDSGGGLVVSTMQSDHKISWFLRGVLSKCGVAPRHTECDPTYYVVYTDVGPHYAWIYHHSGLKYKDNITTK